MLKTHAVAAVALELLRSGLSQRRGQGSAAAEQRGIANDLRSGAAMAVWHKQKHAVRSTVPSGSHAGGSRPSRCGIWKRQAQSCGRVDARERITSCSKSLSFLWTRCRHGCNSFLPCHNAISSPIPVERPIALARAHSAQPQCLVSWPANVCCVWLKSCTSTCCTA